MAPMITSPATPPTTPPTMGPMLDDFLLDDPELWLLVGAALELPVADGGTVRLVALAVWVAVDGAVESGGSSNTKRTKFSVGCIPVECSQLLCAATACAAEGLKVLLAYKTIVR